MNTWMNSTDYLASMAHVGWAAWIVTTVGFLTGRSPHHRLIVLLVLAVGIAAAAVKEYWYDANYELPKQTWRDNTLDFGMYCLGAAAGSAIVFWLAPLCGVG